MLTGVYCRVLLNPSMYAASAVISSNQHASSRARRCGNGQATRHCVDLLGTVDGSVGVETCLRI
jgi:hypothetical protein